MSRKSVISIILTVLLLGCENTEVSDGFSSTQDPGTPAPVSGVDFSFSESSQAELQLGTLNNLIASGSGDLELDREIIGETGQIAIANDIDTIAADTLNYRNTYVDPVVVAYITSRNEADSIDVRMANVGTNSADIFIEDPEADGINGEIVSYMVVERGRHTFANGLVIEADIHNTSSVHAAGDPFGGDVVNFSSAFGSAPVILHSLNTYNNGDFMSTVCDSVGTGSFTLEQEVAGVGSASTSEDIAWIAMSNGVDSINGFNYEIGTADNGANDGVDNAPQTINFTSFASAPDIIVKGVSDGGADGYWMRSAGTLNSTTHTSYAEEDQVADGERSHANETFAFAAFDNNADIGVHYSSGSRDSEIKDLSAVKIAESSNISWNENTPAGTSLSVQTNLSLDGGSSWQGWQTASDGGAIQGISDGTDLSNARLQYRINFSTSDEEATAQLQDLSISVSAKQL